MRRCHPRQPIFLTHGDGVAVQTPIEGAMHPRDVLDTLGTDERESTCKTAWVGLGKANHVAEVDVATRKVRRTVLAGKRAWGLALSADASRLYVANGLSDDMTTIDTTSGKALKTVPAGRVPHSVLVLK